jgi:hypothetical protein
MAALSAATTDSNGLEDVTLIRSLEPSYGHLIFPLSGESLFSNRLATLARSRHPQTVPFP